MAANTDSFYIYLPSNVDTNGQFPDNKPSNFVTPLPDPLCLDHTWQVALVEILFPNYNYNIDSEIASDISVRFYLMRDRIDQKIEIPDGYYDADTFTRAINKEISHVKYLHRGKTYKGPFKGRLKYNPQSKKMTMIFHRGESIRVKNPILRRMMGYRDGDTEQMGNFLKPSRDTSTDTDVTTRRTLPFPCAFNVNGSHMYVYSDIVNLSQVGSMYAPIMRVVSLDHVANQHIETIHKNYPIPHYMSLRSNVIQSINIVLCNDKGEDIKFRQGNSILVLHFRKKPLLKALN